jgi:phage shock protein E
MTALTRIIALWIVVLGTPVHAEVQEFSQQAVLDAGADIVLIDVRTRGEYDSGHIPGSVNIPFDAIRSQPGLLEHYRDRTIVTYCMSGGRAYSALETLEQAGYPRLGHLQGDYSAWIESQTPTQ